MPNRCQGLLSFSKMSEKDYVKLRRIIKGDRFCQVICPHPQEVKKDTMNERKFSEEEKKYREKHGEWRWKEMDEKMRAKYPHKQLWYDWNCHHRWTKWWMCEPSIENEKHTDDGRCFDVYFETARSPLSDELLIKCSKDYRCRIWSEYQEHWNYFSGRDEFIEWEHVFTEQFDDPYFWESERCVLCGWAYNLVDESEWCDMDAHICIYCHDNIIREYSKHTDELKKIFDKADSKADEDTYRNWIIKAIQEKFNIANNAEAEFIYSLYQEWKLHT